MNAYGGLPPPLDQPLEKTLVLLKSKAVVGCDGGFEGGEGSEGGEDGGEGGEGGEGGGEGGEGGEGGGEGGEGASQTSQVFLHFFFFVFE